MKSKKINIIVGGSFHVQMLFDKLDNLGHDVRVYSSTPKFKFKDNFIKNKITYVPMFFQAIKKLFGFNLKPWMKYFDQYMFDKIISLIMRDADIVYGFAFCSLACGKRIKKIGGDFYLDRACPHINFQNSILQNESEKTGIPFIASDMKTILRGIEEYELADKIITPSTYSKKSFLDERFNEKKIFIAPLIGKNRASDFKKRILNNKDSITFAFVGENILRKGLIYVLEAWKLLDNNHNNKLIIRSNNNNIYTNKLIMNLLNQKGIEIKEYYDDINDFYKEVDVLCLPSIDEGFGMVVLEAMSNGIPAIISKNVGASDLLKDKEDGIIIDDQSSMAVLDAMKFFINNKEEIYNYGYRAYNNVQAILRNDLYKDALKKII